jgi:hypothetical protein
MPSSSEVSIASKPAARCNLGWIAALGDQRGQHGLGLGGRQLAVDLHAHQLGERRRVQLGGALVRQVVLGVGERPPASAPASIAANTRPSNPRSTTMATPFAATSRRPDQAGPAGGGQDGQLGPHPLDPLVARVARHQVGIGEVAVVVRLLLDPQGVGAAVVLVPVTGLLSHSATALDQVHLTGGLVVDRPAQRAQRVDVFDLAAGAEGCRIPGGEPTRCSPPASSPPPSCRRTRRPPPESTAARTRTPGPDRRRAGRAG